MCAKFLLLGLKTIRSTIDARKLIPGDYILLNSGNVVPADIRLTNTVNLIMDEAALTGESAPIIKNVHSLPENTPVTDRWNMAFMGTHVVSGHGQGLVMCTDKTGTLTKNEMKVQKIWILDNIIEVSGTGYEPKGIFQKNNQIFEAHVHPGLIALLETGQKCNHAHIKKDNDGWKAIGSPDEAALIVAAAKAGLKQDYQENIIHEFAFDSTRKLMSVIENTETNRLVHVKGAPEVILGLCSHLLIGNQEEKLTQEYYKKIEHAYITFAREGLRTMALARKSYPKGDQLTLQETETDLTFLGIVGLFDPPREEVSNAIEKAKKAGIKVILITGDSPITAQAISKQIGLNVENMVTSSDIKVMNDETLCQLLQQNTLFARTIPQDKFRIVKLLQAQGYITAMTGDGINDAPALKQADIGIAMGIRGTDVARSVADIVLADDNFSSIIDAVEEGGRQYANIRKFVLYLTSSNIGEVLGIFINIAVGGPLILIPIQILWINLVTDSATAVPLSLELAETDLMEQPPRQANQPILNWISFFLLGVFGSYIGIIAWTLYSHYLNQSYTLASTVAFTAIVIMANIHTLNFRNLHRPISEIGWFSNKWLLIGIFTMLGLQITAIYTPVIQRMLHIQPLAAYDWGLITLCALPIFIVPEVCKWLWEKSNCSIFSKKISLEK